MKKYLLILFFISFQLHECYIFIDIFTVDIKKNKKDSIIDLTFEIKSHRFRDVGL